MLAKIKLFLRHVIPAVLKPLRIIWNEIVAFLFFALAAIAVPQAFRTVRNFDGDARSYLELILAALWIAVMTWFGFSSLKRARRIARS